MKPVHTVIFFVYVARWVFGESFLKPPAWKSKERSEISLVSVNHIRVNEVIVDRDVLSRYLKRILNIQFSPFSSSNPNCFWLAEDLTMNLQCRIKVPVRTRHERNSLETWKALTLIKFSDIYIFSTSHVSENALVMFESETDQQSIVRQTSIPSHGGGESQNITSQPETMETMSNFLDTVPTQVCSLLMVSTVDHPSLLQHISWKCLLSQL